MTFKDNLSNHIDAAHPGTFELKYFCSECGKGFMFKYSMTVHYHQVHVKGKVIYPKYYKNSNKSCTFLILADRAVRAALKLSAIFLKCSTFEGYLGVFSCAKKSKIRISLR